jgi:hypothetical protein
MVYPNTISEYYEICGATSETSWSWPERLRINSIFSRYGINGKISQKLKASALGNMPLGLYSQYS